MIIIMRNLCVIKIKEKVFKVRIYIRRSKPKRAILGLAVDIYSLRKYRTLRCHQPPLLRFHLLDF